ncbi:hypothetical protein WJX81_000016 [Elliptochloris bilobata]|uniref:Uncharacterized protein n=1 Tax=Elliptochloris bilobata TaxID=381761 RepID=A0AAW1QI84_9CHLO
MGAPYIQTHITPHIGRAKHLAFSGELPHPPPLSATLAHGSAAYKAQIDQLLSVLANLTDVQKIQAEFFDIKTLSLGHRHHHRQRVPVVRMMQHADYPSGSACYCAAYGKAMQVFLGSDELGFYVLFKAGSSKIDTGVPKDDLSWVGLPSATLCSRAGGRVCWAGFTLRRPRLHRWTSHAAQQAGR